MSTLVTMDHERVRIAHVTDDDIWHERPVRVYESFGRIERKVETRGHPSGLAEQDRLHSVAGHPDLLCERPDQDSSDGDVDARVLAPLYSSADRCCRRWEDVVLNSLTCDCEDHLVTRRDESDITAIAVVF